MRNWFRVLIGKKPIYRVKAGREWYMARTKRSRCIIFGRD